MYTRQIGARGAAQLREGQPPPRERACLALRVASAPRAATPAGDWVIAAEERQRAQAALAELPQAAPIAAPLAAHLMREGVLRFAPAVSEFDGNDTTWSAAPPMAVARAYHGVGVVENGTGFAGYEMVFAAGSSVGDYATNFTGALASVEVYGVAPWGPP